MDQDLRVVPYTPAYREGFAALVVGVLAELGFPADPVLDADLARPEDHYEAAWVALDGDEVVGSVAVRRVTDPDEAELKRMYLLPAYRSKGLGQQLLALVLGWARSNGLGSVRLDTGAQMTVAQRFYEAAGFRRWGERTEVGAGQKRCEVLYRIELRERPPSSQTAPERYSGTV